MVDLPTHYDTGTATITNGSTAVTGQGTSWLSAINVGDQIIGKFGQVGIVSAVGSNTSITLTRTWQGTSQTTEVYAIWFTPDATRMQETTREVLEYLANGYLEAISGLTPADGKFVVGDGTTWVAESGATARSSLGLGTGDSPQLTGIEVGHATDTTVTRASAGDLAVEGNRIFRVGGTDVPVADGGTGASTAAAARTALFGVSTTVDNTLPRYDGTTGAIQTSGVIVDDSNNVSGMGTLAVGAITTSGLFTTSNGQIAMPASQNASAGANTWDDYEEGSWSPSLGGNTTYTIPVAGRYTKTAKQCWLGGRTVVNALGTGSVNTISGMPFTSHTAFDGSPLSISGTGNLAVSIVSLIGSIGSGATTFTVRSRTAASTGDGTGSVFANNADLAFGGAFEASA